MLEEGPRMGMLKRILGREVRVKYRKYGNEGKYGIRKCRRKRKYMGGMGRGVWSSTLYEGPQPGMPKGILEGSTGNKKKCGGKRKYRNVDWYTSKKKKKRWRENRKESKKLRRMKDSWPHIGRRWCSGAAVFTPWPRHTEPVSLRGRYKKFIK